MTAKRKDFDLVIGVTGLKAAGKDELTRYLDSKYGFNIRSCGDEVRDQLRQEGVEKPTIQQQIEMGNRGRRESGDVAYWAKRVLLTCKGMNCRTVGVNGLRHPLEVAGLSAIVGPRFVLIGVVAPTAMRANRLISRGREGDPKTVEDFLRLDDADRGIGQPDNGQQVDRTLACVPWPNLYNNTGTLDEYHDWIDSVIAREMKRIQKKRSAR
jgi:hypothetical protein